MTWFQCTCCIFSVFVSQFHRYPVVRYILRNMARVSLSSYDLSMGCRLVLPEDAAELRQPKASDVLESLETEPESEEDRTCCICLDGDAAAQLPCGHKYHAACLESWFEQRPSCPTCGQFYGDRMGSMPDGSMSWSWRRVSLAGHTCSTIVLHFNFPGGSRDGQSFDGRSQHAYLPDNEEGKKLLAMFQLAFRRKVLFSLTQSLTTGRWQPTFAIHLKTSMTGGPAMHGYPDEQYFDSAVEELRVAGIDLDSAMPVAICLHRGSSQMLKLRCATCLGLCFLNLVQRTLPLATIIVLSLSNDGRMTLYAIMALALAIVLPPKAPTLILLCWLVLLAAQLARLSETHWITVLSFVMMLLAALFSIGHLCTSTRPRFARFRNLCIQIFQRSEAKLSVLIFSLIISGTWRINGYCLTVFILACLSFLFACCRRCVALVLRRIYGTRTSRLSLTEPLLSDMQQVLDAGDQVPPVPVPDLGRPPRPLEEEDWATYASTPSLQGRTNMKRIHNIFLTSLPQPARIKASSVVHEMLANEKRLEGFVPFYHLYAISGLLYELQTVLAVEFLEYPITGPPVMRLSRRPFIELRSLSALLAMRQRNVSDRASEYRSLAVSAFSSCFANGGYAKSIQQYMWEGFPSGTSNYVNKLIEDLLSTAGIATEPDLLSTLKSRINNIGKTYGLTSSPPGQILQIFVHKSVVDAFAYGAQPLGALAPRGIPVTQWLQQQCPLEGQMRLVPHPDLFLDLGSSGRERGLVQIFDSCPSRDIDKLALRRELQAVLRPFLNPVRSRQLLGYSDPELAASDEVV